MSTLTPPPNPALSRTYSFPLTPSPNSPFRAHRPSRTTAVRQTKPYQRPQAEFQCHAQHHLPLSPHRIQQLHPQRKKHHQDVSESISRSAALARSQSLLGRTPPHHHHHHQQQHRLQQPTPLIDQRSSVGGHHCTLQRSETAPNISLYTTACSFTQEPQSLSSPQTITIPIFAAPAENQAPPAPLVFPPEYIEERVAKFLANDQPVSVSNGSEQHQQHLWNISRQSTLIDTSSSALSDQSSFLASYLPTPATSIGSYPYVSAYVPASTTFSQSCPSRSDSFCPSRSDSFCTVASTVVDIDEQKKQDDDDEESMKPKRAKTAAERMEEEKRKQRYAMELIETAIQSINKIWPETKEPDAMYLVNPVTRNGELRTTVDLQNLQSQAPSSTRQPLTPDSSPTLDAGLCKKRKHAEAHDESPDHAQKKRSIISHSDDATRMLSIPQIKEDPDSPVPTQAQHHINPITLRLFVRELLRRSKTSCSTLEVALCYLDGIEDTVKKLKDCVKLGIAFGTAAMAERGPYDEGMKDEGRIIKYEEWVRVSAMEEMELEEDFGGWMPVSPEAPAVLPSTSTSTSPNQVLATHPLLDARRTFLASLVLATKFIQDKAYSNKAWAKLSGLAGREVGRCERALGGALGWRLWVGKYDEGSGSGSGLGGGSGRLSRPNSPLSVTPSTVPDGVDEEQGVGGEDDELAKSFMEEAKLVKEMKEIAKAKAMVVPTNVMESSMGMGSGPCAPVQLAPPHSAIAVRGVACGRARTWPSLELTVDTSFCSNDVSVNVNHHQHQTLAVPNAYASQPRSAPAASTTFSQLSDHLAAVHIQSASSTPCQLQSSAYAPVESHGSWLDTFLDYQSQTQPSTGLQVDHLGHGFHHSPLQMENALQGEESSGVATVPATPATVRITVDDVDAGLGPRTYVEETSLATPYLGMTGSFSFAEATSPPPNFIDPWQNAATYPFTFTATAGSVAQPQQSANCGHQCQGPDPSKQMQPHLLHPQTAALRLHAIGRRSGSSSGSGSSSSPYSSSTFSSPEVLTPVHSRSSTSVDAIDYSRSSSSPLRSLGKSVSMPIPAPIAVAVYPQLDISAALLGGYHQAGHGYQSFGQGF